MQLTITPEASAYLERQFTGKPYTLILEYFDSDSPFNNEAISCQLYTDFRLIALHKLPTDFNWTRYSLQFETALGIIYAPQAATTLLDARTVISYNATYLELVLKGDSGILVPHLPLILM